MLVNGVLFHGSKAAGLAIAEPLLLWDALCNVVIIAHVNWVTAWQPATLLISALASVSFLLNTHLLARSWPRVCAAIHVAGTQAPLAFCLVRFVGGG